MSHITKDTCTWQWEFWILAGQAREELWEAQKPSF